MSLQTRLIPILNMVLIISKGFAFCLIMDDLLNLLIFVKFCKTGTLFVYLGVWLPISIKNILIDNM